MILLFVFIFGLVIGSFLNVIIWRLHTSESFLKGRSYCPHCKHVLSVWDLIPVISFLVQRGRCRYCHKKISLQYPLVELAIGLLFVLSFLKTIDPNYPLLITHYSLLLSVWFFISILIIVFVFDLKYYLIPDKVVLPAIVAALIFQFIVYQTDKLPNFILAAVIGGGFFLLQFLISRGKWIGAGDIRLGLLMGVILGWPGILLALFLAYIMGAVVGILLIISSRKQWSSKVPFGTFLSVATVVALLYGRQIINWYTERFMF